MEKRLKEIIISITNRCNLRCAMCEIPESDKSGEMSTAEVKRVIVDAVALCPRSIVFSGGEPLLRADIFDLITLVSQYKINTCLTSNGVLLTDEVARKLSVAGIGVVNISIEGDEKTHDALRGKGNFAKAVEALKNLAKYKIETTIAATVSRQNYAALPYVLELAHQYGVTTVKFQPFSDIFLIDKQKREKFFASKDMADGINSSITEVVRLSREYKIATNPEDYLRTISAYLCDGVTPAPQKGCSALWTSCPISAQGNVMLCWVLAKSVVGSVKSRKLSDIWESARHVDLRRKIGTNGCRGCMMSCYDNNFGKPELGQLISARTKKLNKASFYKRLYFRGYQNAKYILTKVINKIRIEVALRYSGNKSTDPDILKDIKWAKERFQNKLRSIK